MNRASKRASVVGSWRCPTHAHSHLIMLLHCTAGSLGLLSTPQLRVRPVPALFRRSLRMGAAEPAASALQVSAFWHARLRELTKPQAVSLVPQLSTANALCFANLHKTPGTLVEFAVQEKEKRPDALLLIRVGEFYEAFGLDALMLVQHAVSIRWGASAARAAPRATCRRRSTASPPPASPSPSTRRSRPRTRTPASSASSSSAR